VAVGDWKTGRILLITAVKTTPDLGLKNLNSERLADSGDVSYTTYVTSNIAH
jgi:hypothetical protein